MKIVSKKISLITTIVIVFVVGAVVYSLGYKMAMNKFNSVISYNQEKQEMYSALSEVDYNIRNLCIENIDESKLINEICKGYASGISESCEFFTDVEYEQFVNDNKNLSVDMSDNIINSKIGYIRIGNLATGLGKVFENKFKNYISNNIFDFIIDLRNCDKGKDEEAFEVIKSIISGENILSTIDKNDQKDIVCSSKTLLPDIKVVCLINKYTSGPSELIASCIKDEDKFYVIGDKTSGNAVRKKVISLMNGSVMSFPDAYYVTKSNNNVYKVGVVPSMESSMSEEKIDLLNRKMLDFNEDDQLIDAVNYFD
ncbi:MAG: S41 family peptidase [Acutalibacteraceae bacterium]